MKKSKLKEIIKRVLNEELTDVSLRGDTKMKPSVTVYIKDFNGTPGLVIDGIKFYYDDDVSGSSHNKAKLRPFAKELQNELTKLVVNLLKKHKI